MIYCQIRKLWVKATPEERVRQGVISLMVQKLSFPTHMIAVEKGLHHLSHIKGQRLPLRRADILCYAKSESTLYPLLMIECKAVKLTPKVINQVVGYNHFVKAHYVAIANGEEIRTGWLDRKKKEYCFISGLPAYRELINQVNVVAVDVDGDLGS